MATTITPPTTYGDKTYLHGLPSDILGVVDNLGMALTSFKPEREPEFMSEAEGPDGLVAAIARSKEKITVNASGFIIDKAAFEAATDFKYGSSLFIISKKGQEYAHKGFAKCDFTCVARPNVTT